MVRRWSRINNFNTLVIRDLRPLCEVAVGLNLNATRYFRGTMLTHTTLNRFQWVRRKHLSSWIFFTSVLTLWSGEYKFYKKYTSYVFALNLFRYNYITFNFALLKYLPAYSRKDTETSQVSVPYSKITAFISSRNTSTLTKHLKLSNLNYGLLTTFRREYIDLKIPKHISNPWAIRMGNKAFYTEAVSELMNSERGYFSLVNRLNLITLTAYYRLLVTLCRYRI